MANSKDSNQRLPNCSRLRICGEIAKHSYFSYCCCKFMFYYFFFIIINLSLTHKLYFLLLLKFLCKKNIIINFIFWIFYFIFHSILRRRNFYFYFSWIFLSFNRQEILLIFCNFYRFVSVFVGQFKKFN